LAHLICAAFGKRLAQLAVFNTPIHVVSIYEDNSFVLRPVGIPGIEIRRHLDSKGHMIWTRPDMGGIRVVLERISEPK
jgi:hypothetical protein